MNQISTLIDPQKKAVVLQRIKEGKPPFCAEKPAPEPIAKTVRKKKARKKMNESKNTKVPEINTNAKSKGKPGGNLDGSLDRDLIDTTKRGDWEHADWIIGWGADVNVKSASDRGRTPLMIAARLGYLYFVEELIKRKRVDINAKDNDGRTALSLAVGEDKKKIIELLKEQGAK